MANEPKTAPAINASTGTLRQELGKLREVLRTPLWASNLTALLFAVVATWAGLPLLETTILFVAWVAHNEWRDYREWLKSKEREKEQNEKS